MIETIAPLVKGERHERSPYAAGLSFGLSSLAGGIFIALVGRLLHVTLERADLAPTSMGVEMLAVTAPVALLSVLYLRGWPMPMRDKQVPAGWRKRFGIARVTPMYGFILGAAVLTRINSPAVYIVPIAAVFIAPLWLAIAPALAFATARASIVLWRSVLWPQRVHDVAQTAVWSTYQHYLWSGALAVVVAGVCFVGLAIPLTGL